MTKKNKIVIIAVALIVLAMSAWGYSIIKNRYYSPKAAQQSSGADSPILSSSDENQTQIDSPSANEPATSNSSDETADNSGDVAEDPGAFLNVSNADCENKCADYKDPEDIKYCQQICGLAPKNKQADGCDAANNELERDYCFRDLAISKKDLKICDKVNDKNIKKMCVNEITINIIDQPSQN